MESDDIDHLFKDYKYPTPEKGSTAFQSAKKEAVSAEEQSGSDEGKLRRHYKKAEQLLEERGKIKPIKGKTPKYEKIAYIAIILVLAAYISIDLGFYHKSDAPAIKTLTAAATLEGEDSSSKITVINQTKETASNESNQARDLEETSLEKESEEPKTTPLEEKKLSGIIILLVNNIYSEATTNESGQISRVVFTINNGKNQSLTPVVDVYAYDSGMDKLWETKSRGQYKGAPIEPGESQSGSISLVPKTFRDISLEKNVRVSLNNTKTGFITAVNEKVVIS